MTEKILNCINQKTCMKIKPLESAKINQKSWNCDKNLLTTEQKIYAISNGLTCDIEAAIIKSEKSEWKEVIRKWMKKCPWQLPWVMIILSALQLFFITFDSSDKTYQLLAFSSHHKSDLWRFMTYALIHEGSAHLAMNIILQLFIALPLETEIGHLRVFFVYFGGVLSGSLAACMSNYAQLTVGASSGVYSLLMSHLCHLYLNYQNLSFKLQRILFVTVLTLGDFIHSLTHCLFYNNEEPKIHITAHIAGAISGIILGFIFYYTDEIAVTAKGAKYLKFISIACYLLFICTVIYFS